MAHTIIPAFGIRAGAMRAHTHTLSAPLLWPEIPAFFPSRHRDRSSLRRVTSPFASGLTPLSCSSHLSRVCRARSGGGGSGRSSSSSSSRLGDLPRPATFATAQQSATSRPSPPLPVRVRAPTLCGLGISDRSCHPPSPPPPSSSRALPRARPNAGPVRAPNRAAALRVGWQSDTPETPRPHGTGAGGPGAPGRSESGACDR